MIWLFILLTALTSTKYVLSQNCFKRVFERGMNEESRQNILKFHNQYRQQIARGQVKGQPKAYGMFNLTYDMKLEEGARMVTNSCTFFRTIAADERWAFVGQNFALQRSQIKRDGAYWGVILRDYWLLEKDYFIYPDKQRDENQDVKNYLQLAWADSYAVGCDFINVLLNSGPYAFQRAYVCNYGPGGNLKGQAPYLNRTCDDDLC